jgi:hypothetical protein
LLGSKELLTGKEEVGVEPLVLVESCEGLKLQHFRTEEFVDEVLWTVAGFHRPLFACCSQFLGRQGCHCNGPQGCKGVMDSLATVALLADW